MAISNNPGLLGAIGRGLIAGGGVMSKQVYEDEAKARAEREHSAQKRQDALLSLIFSGVQEGAIDPEQGRAAIIKLRPEWADQLPQGTIGPSAQTANATMEAIRAGQEREAVAKEAARLGLPQNAPKDMVSAALSNDYAMKRDAAKPPKTSADIQLIDAYNKAQQSGDTERARLIKQRIDAQNYRAPPAQLRSQSVNLRLPNGETATGRELPDGRLEVLTDNGYGPVPRGTTTFTNQKTQDVSKQDAVWNTPLRKANPESIGKLSEGFGLGPGIALKAAELGGAVSGNMPTPDGVQESVTEFRMIKDTIANLGAGNRQLAAEYKAMSETLPDVSMTKSPKLAAERLNAVLTQLESKYQSIQGQLNSGGLTKANETELTRQALGIQSIFNRINAAGDPNSIMVDY